MPFWEEMRSGYSDFRVNKEKIMKVLKGIVVIVSVIGLITCLSAFAEDINDGWKKVNESEGIVGYTRPSALTSVDEVMALGIVNAPVPVIESLLKDVSAQPEYMFMCSDAFKVELPELQSTEDVSFTYNKTDMPWPVNDRYSIFRANFMIDASTGALRVAVENISVDFDEKDKNAVRMPITIGQCIATPVGENETEVLYQVLADPGGNLPSWLVNMLSKNLGVKTIEGIREMVKKDKYKNADSVVTTTQWIR
jgi:hypothetical protein